jgi:hypothetical protein
VRRAERKNAGVVDQDVDIAASQLGGLSRDRTGARSVAKIGRDEIGFPPAARISAIVFSPRSTLRPTTMT